MCTVWEEKGLRLAKIRELKAWWRARGTYGCIYRPGKVNRGFKSWLWIVVHIPRKTEGGKVSLASPLAGRLEFLAESHSVGWLG
jgi:hypothetical protein